MWGFFADKVTSSSKASYNKFVRDIRLATEQYKSLGQSKELDAFLKDKVMEKSSDKNIEIQLWFQQVAERSQGEPQCAREQASRNEKSKTQIRERQQQKDDEKRK